MIRAKLLTVLENGIRPCLKLTTVERSRSIVSRVYKHVECNNLFEYSVRDTTPRLIWTQWVVTCGIH